MSGADRLGQLERWYAAQCDGEWEHKFGITIVTSDNPAWNGTIAVAGTTAEGVQIPTFQSHDYLQNSEDWVECRLSDDGTEFWGVGDPSKLSFILDYFLQHVI